MTVSVREMLGWIGGDSDSDRGRYAVRALAAMLLLPVVLVPSDIAMVTRILIYGTLGFAAIVPIGYAGQLILSQAAFFGIGAYTFVVATRGGVPTWISVLFASAFTAIVAYALARPAIRASGIYLGIITFAFNELFVIGVTLTPELGRTAGLSAPDLYFPAVLTNLPVHSEIWYFYVAFGVFVVMLVTTRRLLDSDVGLAFVAIQEDELAARSLGVNTARYRLLSFVFTGAICGIAGGIYAPYSGYISPSMFDITTSIDIILVGVLGGLTQPLASLIGAAGVILLPEVLRFVADYRLMLYGLSLILLLSFLPRGLGGWIEDRL